MLSLRSKLVITLVTGLGVGVLLETIDGLSLWVEPRAEDWYIGWIILGKRCALMLVSVIIDVRKDRPIV